MRDNRSFRTQLPRSFPDSPLDAGQHLTSSVSLWNPCHSPRGMYAIALVEADGLFGSKVEP